MAEKKGKVVVAMSGGVDSSLAAVLLRKEGYEVIGVTMKLVQGSRCCDIEAQQHAKEVCRRFDIPHHVLDVTGEFNDEVIGYFIDELGCGRTPNPCVYCNKNLKFDELLKFARKLGAEFVATGHYARVRRGSDGQYELLKGRDKTKDQSYYLCLLPQKWLARILFPVGGFLKDEIYRLAEEEGLDFLVSKKESQDLCFVSEKFKQNFIAQRIPHKPGDLVSEDGEVLGKHQGVHFYTIGQRKRIDIPNGPYFVSEIRPGKREVVVTKDSGSSALFTNVVELRGVNFVSGVRPLRGFKVMAKVRYQQELSRARLRVAGGSAENSKPQYSLEFDKSQRAVTKGQVAVFYKGQQCLGGGFIN
ncbi:tRNA 2-thiouridine(34) synthase MnmA [Candidatus Peregrinibacteria bacterium]|nr:tRNA 2-thiouridine(34) synthase MnmA [Candidatus Peregrinibacteria bacterium]